MPDDSNISEEDEQTLDTVWAALPLKQVKRKPGEAKERIVQPVGDDTVAAAPRESP